MLGCGAVTEALGPSPPRSGNSGGACVEVADSLPGVVLVRDTTSHRPQARFHRPQARFHRPQARFHRPQANAILRAPGGATRAPSLKHLRLPGRGSFVVPGSSAASMRLVGRLGRGAADAERGGSVRAARSAYDDRRPPRPASPFLSCQSGLAV
nr:DUF397 domain-containing protein [Micromonospora sp. ATCC 39149]